MEDYEGYDYHEITNKLFDRLKKSVDPCQKGKDYLLQKAMKMWGITNSDLNDISLIDAKIRDSKINDIIK